MCGEGRGQLEESDMSHDLPRYVLFIAHLLQSSSQGQRGCLLAVAPGVNY